MAKIFCSMRKTKVVSSKGKSSVACGKERQYSLTSSMFMDFLLLLFDKEYRLWKIYCLFSISLMNSSTIYKSPYR